MSEVSVVILNWNKSDMTIDLVNNFLNTEKADVVLVVVDNGSGPGERERLIKFCKEKGWTILNEHEISKYVPKSKGYLILLNKNYGYAKGNNYGLRFSKMLGYRYAVISNNDVILEEPVIEELVEKIKSLNNVAVIGPKILDQKGREQGPFTKPTILREFFYPLLYPLFYLFARLSRAVRKLRKQDNQVTYPYRLSGCFMLVDLNVLEKVGYFDENTFLYAEEPILAEKLKSIGYRMAYYPKVYVRHLHGVSTIEFGDKRRYFMQLEADLYYYKKYRGYNKFQLLLVKLGRNYSFYVLRPLIRTAKSLLRGTVSLTRPK